ncbi:TraB/GumN family protein [Psychrosphaera haliotis]|uniref:TraB/GumN family protein n=1 Tax=Psychrosphaera haliotis TaxID=555083 RepID=A0A6N8FEZ3_9GAMM|nr:TraB/GumN family protein [Psychrosphaera haliotis]MUH72821.1 TraB/GumN family protein [Psychrosphaera haliotis]
MKNLIKKSLKATVLASVLATSFSSFSNTVWEVKKGEDVVHIGGTVHLLPITEYPLPSAFTDTYQAADSIVLETKLPTPDDQAGQMAMLKAMAYADGETLSQHLSEQTNESLKQYFSAVGIEFEKLNKFKPGFISSMILNIETQKAGMAGAGVDMYFSQLANQDNKSIEYLETLDFQINMLANMGVGNEEYAIKHNLAEAEEIVPLLKKLIKAWRVGDENAINELALVQMKEQFPSSFKAMMTDRNLDWVPKIEALFNDDDQEFVLVGAAHLVGEDSVIEQLKDKGYKVTKL